MNKNAQEDSKLWSQFIDGDEEAFITIYKKHYQELFQFGIRVSFDRELTKDCLQEMFSGLWAKREELDEVSFVRAYLYKYMSRLIQARIQKEIKDIQKQHAMSKHNDLIFDYELQLISDTTQFEKQQKLKAAITKLTKRQKEIIHLKFFEGLDYDEIVEVTGLKQKTIYNIAHEAINELKKLLMALIILMKDFFSFF